MQRNRRLALGGGLGVGLILASVGAGLVWFQEPSAPSRAVTAPPEHPSPAPAAPVTRADLAAVTADLARIRDWGHRVERLSDEVQRDVASLRAHLTQVRQEQEAMARVIANITTTPVKARRAREAGPSRADPACLPPSTPEDELERADTQIEAQLGLLEGAMLAEAPDPAWTDAAERSLQDVFRREEATGFHLVSAECRTTVCRLELSRDATMPPEESFHHLVHLMPWPGQSFVRLEEDAAAAVVVYLAREGHALPSSGQ